MCSTPSEAPALGKARKIPFAGGFAVVYVEEAARSHPRTKAILSRLQNATVIPCKNYKEIFARPHQEPTLQKKSQALILAVSPPPFLYDGAPVCQDFGNAHFYYTSGVMNCIFDCEYCYLQGMYPSGHIVVFVNTEDTFAALDAVLAKHSAYVCISYDTDLLALEPLLHSVSDWMAFAAERTDVTLELRTKSAPLAVLRSLPVLPNVILAITLSPDPVIRAYEHKTPSLAARLSLASEALSLGWPVRLCFDPMLAVHDAQTVYGEMFDEVFAALPMDRIYDASVGVFRISKEYLRTMRKHRPCAVTCYPYELRDGVYAYPADVSDGLLSFARDRLLTVLPKERIFFWESEQEETL